MANDARPINPREPAELERRVRELEDDVTLLRAKVHGSFFDVHRDTFSAATGFSDAADAILEFRAAGGEQRFSQIDRHHGSDVVDLLPQAAQTIKEAFADIDPAVVDNALDRIEKRMKKRGSHSVQGRKPVVDGAHVFLMPFLYLFGGFFEWAFRLLPGFHIGQSQASLLLQRSIDLLAQYWVPRYCCYWGIDWLRKFCAREEKDPQTADAVLYLDGSKMEQERDEGVRGQRAGYSSVAGDHVGQVIGVTINASCWIFELSFCAAGQVSETSLVWRLKMFERINNEAKQRGEHFHLHLIVDRGFRELMKQIEKQQRDGSWPFEHLRVTVEIVEHLGTGDEPERTQHAASEVQKNRAIQARRWVNEKAFAFLKQAHFLDRPLDASVMYHINSILCILAAIANKRAKCPPKE